MTSRLKRLPALTACVALVSVAIVGCGGSEPSTTSTAPPAGDIGASQELQDCLANHGIDVPGGVPDSPTGQPADQPSGDQMKAFEECQQFLPEGMPSGAPPTS